MKRLFIASLLGVFCLMSAGIRASYAGEMDILLEKLVDKGILTGAEAQQVKIETREQIKKEIATGTSASLPAWIQNIKLKGDLRLRYQYKHQKAANDIAKDTHIGRVRARLGLETKINEKLMAGIGIATGSGDPRSTNLTFGSYSTKKSLVFDYGYAKYTPFSWLQLVGGKMKLDDTLWEPTDLIWDSDITPEGGFVHLKKKVYSTDLFANIGALVVDADTSSESDAPMAYIIQTGANYKVNKDISLKGAVSLQNFSNIKGKTSSQYSGASNTGNTTAGSSTYSENFNMFNPAVELKIKEPFKAIGLNVAYLKLIGEYVNNLAVSDNSSGFSCGLKFSNSDKIAKWGDWEVKYIYAMLGRDAVLDVLPDSDRYSGKTGVRSHEIEIKYGLGKNTFLGFDIYRSWRTFGAKAPETLVQVDWNMKF